MPSGYRRRYLNTKQQLLLSLSHNFGSNAEKSFERIQAKRGLYFRIKGLRRLVLVLIVLQRLLVEASVQVVENFCRA